MSVRLGLSRSWTAEPALHHLFNENNARRKIEWKRNSQNGRVGTEFALVALVFSPIKELAREIPAHSWPPVSFFIAGDVLRRLPGSYPYRKGGAL